MPRPIRHSVEFTPESLQANLQQLHNQNEDLRQAALRDYREIKQLTNNGTPEARAANVVNLETARNNAQKAAKEALAQRKDLILIQANVMLALQKIEAAAAGNLPAVEVDTLTSDARSELRKMASEIRKKNG
jgi:hypothetical protein